MPTWLKIVLGILVGSVVICGGVIGAGVLFAKKQLNDTNPADFVAKNKQDACLPEALKKAKECERDGMMCVGKVAIWNAQCLSAAEVVPGYCETIPAHGDALSKWQEQQCVAAGLPYNDDKDPRCGAALTPLVSYCMGQVDGGGDTGSADEDTNEPPADNDADGDTQQDDAPKDKAE